MARNAIDLSGRVAVVTGGAQGIGRAIAERLAESGARVAIWDMDEALARRTAGEIGGGAGARAPGRKGRADAGRARRAGPRQGGGSTLLHTSAANSAPAM